MTGLTKVRATVGDNCRYGNGMMSVELLLFGCETKLSKDAEVEANAKYRVRG